MGVDLQKKKRLAVLFAVFFLFGIIVSGCEKNISGEAYRTRLDVPKDNMKQKDIPKETSTITCTDTDGGFFTGYKGQVILSNGLLQTDFCINSSFVAEFSCANSSWSRKDVFCQGICSDGVCSS